MVFLILILIFERYINYIIYIHITHFSSITPFPLQLFHYFSFGLLSCFNVNLDWSCYAKVNGDASSVTSTVPKIVDRTILLITTLALKSVMQRRRATESPLRDRLRISARFVTRLRIRLLTRACVRACVRICLYVTINLKELTNK